LTVCIDRKNECLNRITAAEVLAGCKTILKEKMQLPTSSEAKAESRN
jgi:hypothetical protein